MSKRKTDICGLQEVRWRGAFAKLIEEKDSRYKLFWVGNGKGMGGVGILLAENWVEVIFDVKRVSDRIVRIKLVVGKSIVTAHVGLDDSVKELFYENLPWTLTKISASKILFVRGDFNGHIGKNTDGYEGVHGVRGFGRLNLECQRILEYAVVHNVVVSNSLFTKRESFLVTYKFGENLSQIHYMLDKRQYIALVHDVVIHPKRRMYNPAQITCL